MARVIHNIHVYKLMTYTHVYMYVYIIYTYMKQTHYAQSAALLKNASIFPCASAREHDVCAMYLNTA